MVLLILEICYLFVLIVVLLSLELSLVPIVLPAKLF
jgi:hypothetical protein